MNTADLELEIELCSNSSFSNDSEIEVYINTFNKYLPCANRVATMSTVVEVAWKLERRKENKMKLI